MALMDKVKKLVSGKNIVRKREEENNDAELSAKLAGDRDNINAQVRSVIAQLQAKGIDTAGLSPTVGGSVRTAADAEAQVSAAASMESAASGKLLQNELAGSLGALIAPVLPMLKDNSKDTGVSL